MNSAVVTSLKPAEADISGACILRFWETKGQAGPFQVDVGAYKQAFLTDVLERDLRELGVEDGAVNVDLRPHGFAAIRLLP